MGIEQRGMLGGTEIRIDFNDEQARKVGDYARLIASKMQCGVGTCRV